MKAVNDFRHSGTKSSAETGRERKNRAIARKAAAEGFVLLKNEGLLPFEEGSVIALLGSAGHIIKGGTGSGDVNQRDVVNIDAGLRNAGVTLTTENWLADFDRRYHDARIAWRDSILGTETGADSTSVFNNYAEKTFRMPDGREITDGDVEGAQAAVYVISRVAGEAADRKAEKGDYYLTEKETADLQWLDKKGIPTVLILNAGGPVELTEVSELPSVKAILFISQPGQEGGNAAADVLLGKAAPSGKLTDTWAKQYRDYPNAETFSYLSGDTSQEFYREGIYVGYRYFDSFGVKPLFPFGYGLSYAQFEIKAGSVKADGCGVEVPFTVTNTGDQYAGKEVVQVYITCPQTGIHKEYQRLGGFVKTPLLAPGERCEGSIAIPAKQFASFDEEKSAWIAEAGKYGLWIGNSSVNTELAAVLAVQKEAVLEEVPHICPMQEWLPEMQRPDGVLDREAAWHAQAAETGIPEIPFAPTPEKKPLPYGDSISQEAKRISIRAEIEELLPLFYGEMSKGQGAIGAAGIKVPGSAAETSGALEKKYRIAPVVLADGPAGLRLNKNYDVDKETDEVIPEGFLTSLEGGFFAAEQTAERENAEHWHQFCTAFPVGTLLAQSFNTALAEEVGRAVAEEMGEFHVGWWLAPGMNIHRNPLCGRNFEYYSEDPLVSGVIAAAITHGVQSLPGTGTTIKHFACNNQEDNRMLSDSIVSERALREIYLRGFEIAVKTSQPMCIMTSYNLLNGIHTANSYDLCTQAARKEWGFAGVIMTDWTTTMHEGGSIPWKCIAAGNDIIMPGDTVDEVSIKEAAASGELSEEVIRKSAERIINMILRTNSYKDAEPYGKIVK